MGIILWLCVLALIRLLYQYVTKNFNHWKNQNVPYLPPAPIFGNIFKAIILKQSYGQLIKKIYNYAESKCTGFFIFGQPSLVIRDPNLIKRILIQDFEYFDRRSMAVNKRDDVLGAKILFNLRNPEWKEVRTKLTPVFTSGKIKNMLDLILTVSNNLEDFIQQEILNTDGIIDSKELSQKYTTDVISSCAFGINSHSFKFPNAEFVTAARKQFIFTFGRAIQWACYSFAPYLVKVFKMKLLEPTSTEFLRSVFWEQLHQRAASNKKRGDLVDILLKMKAEIDNLDRDDLVAQAIMFFLAGFETSGNTILFVQYEMAANKDVQKRLRDDIKNTLKVHGEISYEAIKDMKYLHNVVKETLRKYPAITYLDRSCNKTYTIPEINLTIQEGMPVFISLLGLHMDPAHFPDPDRFDPDRFSVENKERIKPFSYMPFGDGPRNCIGSRFALLSVKTAIIAIFSHFDVDLDPRTPYPTPFDPKSSILLTPAGENVYLRYKQIPQESSY